MEIKQLRSIDKNVVEAFEHLINQLNPNSPKPTFNDLESIINNESTVIFLAYENGSIVGTTTLVFYNIPTGKKAWIEDVVVDHAHRGKGYGKQLMQYAIEYARNKDTRKLNLTSNPTRIAANKLYQELGFEQYITNMYRLDL